MKLLELTSSWGYLALVLGLMPFLSVVSATPAASLVRRDDSPTCPGDTGMVYNNAKNECECPGGKTYDEATSKCGCQHNRNQALGPNGECVSITCFGSRDNLFNCWCLSEIPLAYYPSTNMCKCPSDMTFNRTKNKCECPISQNKAASPSLFRGCVEVRGTAGGHYTCVDKNLEYNQKTNTCQCPSGKVFDPITNSCECDIGKFYNKTSSQCEDSGCLNVDDHREALGPGGECFQLTGCGRGYEERFTCKCPVDMGLRYNSRGQTCQCLRGTTWNSNIRKCGCPAGETYNSTAAMCERALDIANQATNEKVQE